MVGQVRTCGAGGRMWREKETLQVHGVSLDVGLKIHYRLIQWLDMGAQLSW
jgi:hypothetical protein